MVPAAARRPWSPSPLMTRGKELLPTDLPHIFDPFYTTRADGTGLGLSIVQQIIQEHGGTIEVQSQVARGTSFILHLPMLQTA